jgi:hypothetical protein
MKVTGIVEKIDTSQKDRAIKIDVKGAAKPLWVSPELHPQIRDLKEGDEACFEVADTMRWYYVFRSWERASAQTKQEPPESPQTEEGPEPPKTEITVSEPQLPDSVEGLQQFILVTHEALKIYHAKLNAVNKLNVAKAIQQQTLLDAQKVGEALLWAKAKLGELLKPLTEGKGYDELPSKGGRKPTLPEGITYKQSHYAQQLAKHPELIRETVNEAIEDEDIPTQTVVMHKIKALEVPPKPVPPEQWKDCGQFDCPVCKGTYRILHLSEGRHKLESVEVTEK